MQSSGRANLKQMKKPASIAERDTGGLLWWEETKESLYGIVWRRESRFFPLDRFVHFFAMHGNRVGGRDAQTHLVSSDVDDSYLYIIADHDCFVALARKH